jgi:hypothetical protein
MSHNKRLHWLKSLGWLPDDRGADLAELGRSVIVRGIRLGQDEAFWLAARDGSAVVHGENTPVKSWEELQAWVTEKPEAKKPLDKQRNLFDLDSD